MNNVTSSNSKNFRKSALLIVSLILSMTICESFFLKSVYAQTVPELIKQLKEGNKEKRKYAALALGELGQFVKYEKEVVPQLVHAAIKDEDSSVRESAAKALEKLVKYEKGIVTQLTAALKDKAVSVRGNAAATLGGLGKHAKGAVPHLIKVLKDKDVSVRKHAIFAIRSLGEHAEEAVPHLIKALKDRDVVVRAITIIALESLGDRAKEAVPHLVQIALRDQNPSVRGRAASALGSFGKHAEKAIPHLVQIALRDRNADVRNMARNSLLFLGEHAKGTIPQFIKALKDKNALARSSAIDMLLYFNEHSKVFPQLVEALKDPDASVRRAAVYALGSLDEQAKKVIPQFIKALHDEDPLVRANASVALVDIRKTLSPNEEENFDKLLKKTGLKKVFPNVCETLCKLANTPKLWMGEKFNVVPEVGTQFSWSFAIHALGALFVAKASSFCKGAEKITRSMVLELAHSRDRQITGTKCPQPSPFKNLKKIANNFLENPSLPKGAYSVYGKQFYSLFLGEILKRKSLSDFQRKTLQQLHDKANLSLFIDIQRAEKAQRGLEGSLFNTYALSSSVLAVKEKKAIISAKEKLNKLKPDDLRRKVFAKVLQKNEMHGRELLKTTINPKNPLRVLYDLLHGFDDPRSTPIGSLGRASTAHLTLYKKETNKKKKNIHRKNLKKAIKFYIEKFFSLEMHIKRRGGHLGKYGIGTYYLYPSLPYVSAALKFLLNEKKSDKKELENMQKDLKISILSLVEKNGLFESPQYLRGKYHNPMGGLALIPFADDCVKKGREKALLGIISVK